MAWNLDKVSSEGVTVHLKHWLERELGTSCAKAVLPLCRNIIAWRISANPDLWEIHGRRKIIRFIGWSKTYRGAKRDKRTSECLRRTFRKRWRRRPPKVPIDRQSAYFELVKYPVQAAAQMNRKLLYAQLARHDKVDWEKSDAAYE